jgi:hypothetical protein
VQTLFEMAALVAAVGSLVPAFFLTWWLAGSDDEALNSVAPLLGLLLFGTSIASVVVAARMFLGPDAASLLVMAAPLALFLLAALFAGNRVHGRPRLRQVAEGVAVLSPAPLLALGAVLTA